MPIGKWDRIVFRISYQKTSRSRQSLQRGVRLQRLFADPATFDIDYTRGVGPLYTSLRLDSVCIGFYLEAKSAHFLTIISIV